MKINFIEPFITNQDIQAMVKVIKSGWINPGGKTKQFEKNFASYLGVKNAVMTNSCTGALHISLVMAGIKEGDEVITTPFSFVATSNVILYQRAIPVFVDVEPTTGLIDIDKIEKKITKKTKAIIPVHVYGQMVDMIKLKKIANKYNLIIIEDASHAIEASRDGVKPGQLSFSACFSFHTFKNITSGQGGVLATNNNNYAKQAIMLRRDGVINVGEGVGTRRMFRLGFPYDSTDYQAVMLDSQLSRIDVQYKKRVELYQRYKQAFEKSGVRFFEIKPKTRHAHHMFTIMVEAKKRDIIRRALASASVGTNIHYDPIHLEPYYKKTFGYKKGDFPVAEKLGAQIITLPFYIKMTSKQQKYIINKVNELSGK